MGKSESKIGGVGFDEASKKATEDELTRLRNAFKRSSHLGYMNKALFSREVLTDAVPPELAARIYDAVVVSSRGITQKELIVFLVVLVCGTPEQRMKLLFSICSADGECITQPGLDSLIAACDGRSPASLTELFASHPRGRKSSHLSRQQQLQNEVSDSVDFDAFSVWAAKHYRTVTFMHWILGDEPGTQPCLSDNTDTPTFYQVMAGITKLSDTEVASLEQRYWQLKGSSKTGKLDLETFSPLVTPPLPPCVCQGLHSAIDSNTDGHLDFKELSCAIATISRNPVRSERLKFCFRIFDFDRDGVLNGAEQDVMLETLSLIDYSSTKGTGAVPSEDAILHSLIANSRQAVMTALDVESAPETIAFDEFCKWAETSSSVSTFLTVLLELCHITLGLRPKTPLEEGKIVRGWIRRDQHLGFPVKSTWYLISRQWFNSWLEHTSTPSSDASSVGHGEDLVSRGMSTEYTTVSVSRPKEPDSPDGDGCLPQPSRPSMVRTKSASRGGGGGGSGGSAYPTQSMSPGKQDPDSAGLSLIDNSVLCASDNNRKMSMIITQEGGQLRRGLHIDRDFMYVSEPVWRALHTWYNGGPALPRSVIMGPQGAGLELYLYTVKLYRHTFNNNIGRGSSSSAMTHLTTLWAWALNMLGTSSGTSSMTAYYPTSASSSAASSSGSGVNAVNQPPLPRRYLAHYAALSRSMSVTELEEFVQQKFFLKPDDFKIWLMKDESPSSVLEDGDVTLEQLQLDGKSVLVEIRNKDQSWPEELISMAANVKSKKEEKKKVSSSHHVEKGTTGLSNLGNTCFMNSALQCISNTQPLSLYFCYNKHLDELNRTNPLGMKGHVAKRYGDLVQDLWSGTSKSIAPLKFRLTIARYAPRFNSFQQQDAQELLAFLLDGLHEDLNRVTDKPYVELQDSEGRGDVIVAKEAWDYHRKRNQSVVVDLFHGQLKSSVRCLTCGHTNNRFDPFTFLSLPLPMENTVYLEVIVIRLDGTVPIRYAFRLSPESRYTALKAEISNLTNIAANQILLAEIFGSSLRGLVVDSNKIRHALAGTLHAFEVPIPAPILPTESSGSVERLHLAERLERLRGKSATTPDRLATNTALQRSPTPNDGEKEEDAAAACSSSAGDDGTTMSPPASSDRSASASPSLRRDSRTHAQATSNEPTEDSTDTSRCELAAAATIVTATADPDHGTDTGVLYSNGLSAVSEDFVEIDSSTPATGSTSAPTVIAVVHADGVDSTHVPPASTNTVPESRVTVATAVRTIVVNSDEVNSFIFAFHRKSYLCDVYFLAHGKMRPSLFGAPVAVPCDAHTTKRELYQSLARQLKRFLAPPDPDMEAENGEDGDHPFVLREVRKDGLNCCKCVWWKFCTGCELPCDDTVFKRSGPNTYLAIDWNSTALHLRYQNSQERAIEEDESIKKCQESLTESISLEECLDAFTKEEELGEEDPWYCCKCKKHQLAVKKLDIWKLPPILIVHMKRFQFVNGQWVKSQKPVKYPFTDFCPPSLSQLVRPCSPCSDGTAATSNGSVTNATDATADQGRHGDGLVTPDNDTDGNKSASSAVPSPVDDSNGFVRPASTSAPADDSVSAAGSDGSAAPLSTEDPLDARHVGLSDPVTVESDPLNDELALQDIVHDIQAEGLKDRLDNEEKIDDQTLHLAKLNEPPLQQQQQQSERKASSASTTASRSTSLGHTVSGSRRSTETPNTVASAATSTGAGSANSQAQAATGSESVSPSQSFSGTASRKARIQATMLERLGGGSAGSASPSTSYNLYAMTTHQGMLGGGHYVSFACNPNAKWYCYNDSTCKEIDQCRVQEESPYLLFYESSRIDYSKCLSQSRRRQNTDSAQFDEEDELDRDIRNNCSVM